MSSTDVEIIALNYDIFPALGHWELSHTITTHHLLSLISITNTLTSVSNASFIPEQVPYRRQEEILEKVSVLHTYLRHIFSKITKIVREEPDTSRNVLTSRIRIRISDLRIRGQIRKTDFRRTVLSP
jgi:hypothetical protein